MNVRIDPAVEFYNGAVNDYDLAKDPRCLFGWGPPGCLCRFGHFCCRELGHPGLCDARTDLDPLPCMQRRRPAGWDSVLRAEANR